MGPLFFSTRSVSDVFLGLQSALLHVRSALLFFLHVQPACSLQSDSVRYSLFRCERSSGFRKLKSKRKYQMLGVSI